MVPWRIDAVPRPLFVLTLLVAFSGTPLRLAEAADDLARGLAGPEVTGEFEAVDGGVGDDSGESIRADPARDSIDAPSAWVAMPLISPAPLPSLDRLRSGRRPSPHPPSGSPRRHLLLERFLC